MTHDNLIFKFCFLTTFKIFLASIQKADDKAQMATYTSDMDTEKESKYYRKYRAKKVISSSESEEEPCTSVVLPIPPRPPARRKLNCIYYI